MPDRLKTIKNMVEAMDGDLTAQIFGCEMNAKAIVDDFKWLIGQLKSRGVKGRNSSYLRFSFN
ncbi:hypothetical protein BEP19_14950 [Ammoniphilus oxalaticus]|uniref:Uncharacterized protein n=1 Tax=Ammoniphilus oxalaticus TaxID=66863 RepID=A0A419SCX4_9BACL|nr:hypothetical protein [Ammoniphilus oxalaticus]RKD20979.1 hypothetical protein BEP19_14950 [Ammoniphilus oxalaticus]